MRSSCIQWGIGLLPSDLCLTITLWTATDQMSLQNRTFHFRKRSKMSWIWTQVYGGTAPAFTLSWKPFTVFVSLASKVREQAQIKKGQDSVRDYKTIKRLNRDGKFCILFCLGHSEVIGLEYHIEKTHFHVCKGGCEPRVGAPWEPPRNGVCRDLALCDSGCLLAMITHSRAERSPKGCLSCVLAWKAANSLLSELCLTSKEINPDIASVPLWLGVPELFLAIYTSLEFLVWFKRLL